MSAASSRLAALMLANEAACHAGRLRTRSRTEGGLPGLERLAHKRAAEARHALAAFCAGLSA